MPENETPEIKLMIEACRSLRADAVALESDDYTTVVAMSAYDGTYAAVRCDPGVHLSLVARSLQVRLLAGPSDVSPAPLIPAIVANAALRQWEHQIALVFGKQYASRLVAGVSGAKAPGEFTAEDLERIRLRLASATGGCLDFRYAWRQAYANGHYGPPGTFQ